MLRMPDVLVRVRAACLSHSMPQPVAYNYPSLPHARSVPCHPPRRDVATQERKRLLFSALTDEGAVFWSDFLDLQAQGPIPWRNEISHAIQSCSKVVALVDEQYLLSYNCLEVRPGPRYQHRDT